MAVELLTKEEEGKYSNYIENNPQASFEYTLKWRDILERNFSFKAYHLIYKNEKGEIQGVLPLFKARSIFGTRLVSTPYAVYTGVLADNEEARKELITFSKELAVKEKVDFLEIREREESGYPNDFQVVKRVFNFSLGLGKNSEEVWKKLPKGSVRWGIKKAQQSGLSWTVGNSQKELDDFYQLFLQTRKFRGVPGYPYKLFKEIMDHFKVKIYTARLGERAVASIFLIYYKKEMRYAFAGAVYEREILNLQPYHLIMWEAIKGACLEGYTMFNLGGATLDTNDGGLYEFKKKWADSITSVPYYYYLNRVKKLPEGEDSRTLRLASRVWKRLPLSLIRLLSPKVIKQFV